MIKSRWMGWAGNVACTGTKMGKRRRKRRRMHTGFWWESHKERYHQEDQDVDVRKILKWILER
jgi:hypothetical protein